METGNPLKKMDFDKKYFIEGSVVFNDNIYILTWDSKVTFAYGVDSLDYRATWKYPREGWGLTTDGTNLIASDGSSMLYFMDKDMKFIRKVQVTVDSTPLRWLNELEYIDGKIWANVYTYDEIVIINPTSGKVEAVVDCRGLLPKELHTASTDVLNGIAYNPKNGKIYLTGKNWPKLYEVKLIEAR
jgi:glutamine cyclotransferase